MHRGRVFLVLAALTLTLLAPLPTASAQTFTQPLCSPPPGVSKSSYCTYDQHYLVLGRIVDSNGDPARGARLRVEIAQPGTTDAAGRAPFQDGVANCKGDFEFSFQGLRQVIASGRVKVTVLGADGHDNATFEQPLDAFWRRNDLTPKLDYVWPFDCTQAGDPEWNIQLSVKGRIVNRTEPYEVAGATYHARTEGSQLLGLTWWDASGVPFCPPDGRGGCQPIPTDELGNFKYTWTFERPIEPGGHVAVRLLDGQTFNASVDPTTRLALHQIEPSGKGAHRDETPGPAVLLVLGALALAALARRK